MEGLNVPPNVSYCSICREPVRGIRRIKFWILIIHLILTILSGGWWVILFIAYFFLKPKTCPVCLNSKLKSHPMGQ
ncbi:MAG: hypothetical protein HOD90_03240 [Nitrospina sp.]|jgi:hypothetical protein|nr:hypothetical protein [Nitrospina sp.]